MSTLSTAHSGCRQACLSRTFLLLTSVHLEWKAAVVFHAVYVHACCFAREDKPLSSRLIFSSNYSFSISWWGLVKTAKTSERLCSPQLWGRENGGGEGGGRGSGGKCWAQMKIMRVEGSSGGGAAVLHMENHVLQRIHLHLSDAPQPGLLPVKSSCMCSKVSTRNINAFDGNLIYKIMEQFPRNRHFRGKL